MAAIVGAIALLGGCGDDKPKVAPIPTPTPTTITITPAGRLVQSAQGQPASFTTLSGWRVEIAGGALTVKPSAAATHGAGFQYVSRGTRELLGRQELRSWAGDRRSMILPGGAKLTMWGQGGNLLRVSIYDGDNSHEIDVLTMTIMHSQVNTTVAESRDQGEHDGETGHLAGTFSHPDYSWLYLGNLYTQAGSATRAPQEKIVASAALGRQFAGSIIPHTATLPVLPAETDATCEADGIARGGLQRTSGGQFEYRSRSGMWVMKLDKHTITLTRLVGDKAHFTWEVWGDPHENLNGKHIKDWEVTSRTLMMDDGTKITMHADGPQHVVHTTSIYDGAQSHEIGNAGNVLRHSCVNATVARERETREWDGETAQLVLLPTDKSAIGGLLVQNIYTETAPAVGSLPLRSFLPVLLGSTGEPDVNPNQINDYYDDPRLSYT
ncbi:hypothetical protein [Croceibacterium xixiisoli]|nr:hypothetical protein [Croceibacterium xixiisoli]